MTETDNKKKKGTLSLSGRGTLGLSKTPDSDQVRQNIGQGKSKTVTVEVKRSRTTAKRPPMTPVASPKVTLKSPETTPKPAQKATKEKKSDLNLTNEERNNRLKVLDDAAKYSEELKAKREEKDQQRAKLDAEIATEKEAETQRKAEVAEVVAEKKSKMNAEELRRLELEEMNEIKAAEEEISKKAAAKKEAQNAAKKDNKTNDIAAKQAQETTTTRSGRFTATRTARAVADEKKRQKSRLAPNARGQRRGGKMTISQALAGGGQSFKQRSAAAMRRQRQKAKMAGGEKKEAVKVIREVIIPETITVQELANRMTEKGADVVKTLMGLGVMATINQSIDGDTAELVVEEMGHKIKRVSESDIEIGIEGEEDKAEDLVDRAPIVTVMGHVDHGKTSLLDALRKTDIATGEAGGITQHIGAYQVELESGSKLTFLDTPGHAAFTEMRQRGATVTDVVVLVVAANDSIMPQTIEAISHAKAAEVPVVVAINKCDLEDADPQKVRMDMLSHELIVEEMGGDILAIDVSAKTGKGLLELQEAILLQAELLDLKANPNRAAVGAVIESKMEKGRGSVATILVETGTIHVGDVFVAGAEWGKVRALVDYRGESVEEAGPSMPVEVLGIDGMPEAGDRLTVLPSESRAREISDYRRRMKREAIAAKRAKSNTFEALMEAAQDGEKQTLSVVIKGDVHGSVEAIAQSLGKLVEENKELDVQVLHSGVGAINESDVQLAAASNAFLIGFNVRANPQARDLARREVMEIRYYSVIYNIIDDVKAVLGGMLSPEIKEDFLGNAEIRDVFNVSKVGKVAGCMVTEGKLSRGASVRLLRDNVVIHEGKLKTLRRFKDDVNEVSSGYECGAAFERYDDVKSGDVIECFNVREVARELD